MVGIFGIRGVGTFFYLSYALGHAEIPDAPLLWATAAFVVIISVVLHGVAATPVMERLDRMHERSHVQSERAGDACDDDSTRCTVHVTPREH